VTHAIYKCKCGKLVMQCRCPAPNKPVLFKACSDYPKCVETNCDWFKDPVCKEIPTDLMDVLGIDPDWFN
jgi:hypothetical protein